MLHYYYNIIQIISTYNKLILTDRKFKIFCFVTYCLSINLYHISEFYTLMAVIWILVKFDVTIIIFIKIKILMTTFFIKIILSYTSFIDVFNFGSFLNFFDVNATSMNCKYWTHNCNTIIFKLGLAPSSIISSVSPKSIKL